MIRAILFFAMLIVGSSVFAAGAVGAGAGSARVPAKTPFYFDLYLYNTEARFEKGLSQNLVSRNSLNNYAIGGRYGSTAVLFEYAMFNQPTGNASLSISSTRREYMLWWKQYLHSFEYCDLISTLGLGGYQEEVRTSLFGSSVTDQGDSSAMAGAGLGLSTLVFKYVLLSFEGRLMAGSNFDPNPSAGLLFRSGLEF